MTDKINNESELWDLLHQEVYTPQEASEVLNIAERIILKAAYGGDLKAMIVNGDVVEVTRTDLVAWVKAQELI